jgi:hypothetical protein
VIVRWRPAPDPGSGLAAHEIVLDGRRARSVPAVRSLGTLVVSTEPELDLGRLAPGVHRVTVRAVDRAGNRGAAAVRRLPRVALAASRRNPVSDTAGLCAEGVPIPKVQLTGSSRRRADRTSESGTVMFSALLHPGRRPAGHPACQTR